MSGEIFEHASTLLGIWQLVAEGPAKSSAWPMGEVPQVVVQPLRRRDQGDVVDRLVEVLVQGGDCRCE